MSRVLHPRHGIGRGAQHDIDILLRPAERDLSHGRPTIDRAQFLAHLRSRQAMQQRPAWVNLHIDERRCIDQIAGHVGRIGCLLHGIQHQLRRCSAAFDRRTPARSRPGPNY